MKKLENKFQTATDFSQGKAFVKTFDDRKFCINKFGHILFEAKGYNPAYFNFNEHKQLIIRSGEKNLYGVIDSRGNEVIPCKYDYIWENESGYLVEKNNMYNQTDYSGNNVLPFFCSNKINIIRGLTPIQFLDKWGCYSVFEKEMIIPFKYNMLNPCNNGLLSVICNNNCGIINFYDDIIVPFEYENIAKFWDYFIPVQKKGKWGLIDLQNNLIIPFIYDSITPENNMFIVEKNKKFGILNERCESITDIIFDYVDSTFINGITVAKLHNKYGMINTEGKIIVKFEYEFCGLTDDGLIEVRKEGKCGFMDMNQNVIIPIYYDAVGLFGFKNEMCLVQKDWKCGYIDKQNNVIIKFQYEQNSGEFQGGLALVEIKRYFSEETFYKYILPNGQDAF